MKIRFVKQEKRDIGPVWASNIKVFYFGLYWFGIQISFGKRPFDAIAYHKFLKDHFDRRCLVCHRPLHVSNIGQSIKYHKECRRFRHHINDYHGPRDVLTPKNV